MSSRDFNSETLLKFLAEIREHKNCPYFEEEVVRLIRDLVTCLNDPRIVETHMFRLKIAPRWSSS